MARKSAVLFLAVFAAVVLIVAACAKEATPTPTAATPAPAPPAKTFTWKCQSSPGPGDLGAELMKEWAQRVTERTNGRLTVEFFYGGDLVPAYEEFEPVSKGVIDCNYASGLIWGGIVPVLGTMGGVPFSVEGTFEDSIRMIDETGLRDLWQAAYNEHNIYQLNVGTQNAYPVIFSNVPIRSADDYKGKKIRALGNLGKMVTALGGSAVTMPGQEIYMALRLGTVDAAGYTVEGAIDLKWYEVMKYYILPGWNTHLHTDLIVNMDSWKALPPDLQQIANEEGMWFGNAQKIAYGDKAEETVARAAELGYEVITIPDAEVKKMRDIAVQKVWPEIAALSPRAAQAIDAYKSWFGYK